MQLNQPVKVIRHHHPGERGGIRDLLSSFELMHQQASDAPIREERLPFMGDCGQQIDAAGLRATACT
ncbi:hypothetical protein D3C81_2303880 [compost metagenome]